MGYGQGVEQRLKPSMDYGQGVEQRLKPSMGYGQGVEQRLKPSMGYGQGVEQRLKPSMDYGQGVEQRLKPSMDYGQGVGQRLKPSMDYGQGVEPSDRLTHVINMLKENPVNAVNNMDKKELKEILDYTSDSYYNKNISLIPDQVYDYVKKYYNASTSYGQELEQKMSYGQQIQPSMRYSQDLEQPSMGYGYGQDLEQRMQIKNPVYQDIINGGLEQPLTGYIQSQDPKLPSYVKDLKQPYYGKDSNQPSHVKDSRYKDIDNSLCMNNVCYDKCNDDLLDSNKREFSYSGFNFGRSTKLQYDPCFINDDIEQSTQPLLSILDPNRVKNNEQCLSTLGPRSGHNGYGDNIPIENPGLTPAQELVDIDSIMSNRNVKQSRCKNGNVNPIDVFKFKTYNSKECNSFLNPLETINSTPKQNYREMSINRFYDLNINPQVNIYYDGAVNTQLEAKDNFANPYPYFLSGNSSNAVSRQPVSEFVNVYDNKTNSLLTGPNGERYKL
jgi:hypothetical protein